MEKFNHLGMASALVVALAGFTVNVQAAIVHNQDTIIQGSACVGFDCVSAESFGFDTIRLKENNLRIKFDDTSSSASFPSNDWMLVANDTSNGGANYFAIQDVTVNRIPFRVFAGAPSNALIVNSGGKVGIGTGNPIVNLHVTEGNTPTLRLEQDGSDGFAVKTYDIAANETNFFVRDVNNGSKLIFRIMNNAPADALVINADGDIGMGVQNADGSVHIKRGNSTPATLLLEQTAALSNVGAKWEVKVNQNTGRLTFKNLNATNGPNGNAPTPFKFSPTAVENLLRVGVAADNVVDIAGDLVISGNCTEMNGACADYVFEDDYELRSLEELAHFIEQNKHLPNIPSADAMTKNGVSVGHISGRLLEKIEELTLYTLQQHETINTLASRVDELQGDANLLD